MKAPPPPPYLSSQPPKTIIIYLNDQASAASSKFFILARLLVSMWYSHAMIDRSLVSWKCISVAQFSISIWCAYDMHLPNTPEPNHYALYACWRQFLCINSTPNINRKSCHWNKLSWDRVSNLVHFRIFLSKYTISVLMSIQVNTIGNI